MNKAVETVETVETVEILMATYNGEKYINEQISSLQGQTFKNWKLIIQDDGSTDSTLEIIRNLSADDNRIFIVEKKSHEKLGAGRNFFSLLHYSKADFIMFCDQDDIWLPKKIEYLLKYAKENFDKKTPCLVHSDAYIYNSSTGLISNSRVAVKDCSRIEDFIFSHGGYQGSAMLFNKALRDISIQCDIDEVSMHDHFITTIALSLGLVFFLNKKLMLYRLHDENVCGIDKKSYIIDNFRKTLISKEKYNEKLHIYEKFNHLFNKKNKSVFQLYIDFPKKKFISKIFQIIKSDVTDFGSKKNLIIKLILRKTI